LFAVGFFDSFLFFFLFSSAVPFPAYLFEKYRSEFRNFLFLSPSVSFFFPPLSAFFPLKK